MAVHSALPLRAPEDGGSGKGTMSSSSHRISKTSNSKGKGGISTLLILVVVLLLGVQFFQTQSCQRQFGDALLSGYTTSFNSLAASVGYGELTYAPEPQQDTGILTGHYDICIAGAGLSGSVLAERYANVLEKKVLVVEKRNHIGGNCYDYNDVS